MIAHRIARIVRNALVPGAAALAVLAASGCGSSGGGTPLTPTDHSTAQRTTVVTDLPRVDGTGSPPDSKRHVSLHVGQMLAVRYQHTDSPGYWREVDGGNPKILTPAGSQEHNPCADSTPAKVGCSYPVQQHYRAVAPGRTTLEWRFAGLAPQPSASPGQRTESCASGMRCPVGSITIVVTVTG